MTPRDVEGDLATVLNTAGLGVSMADTPPSLYAGPFPDTAPDLMVSVRFSGGSDTEDFVNRGRSLFAAEAQVIVRGNQGRYGQAADLARAVWSALHLATVPGYLQVKSEGAGPSYLGPDATGRPVFVFTAGALYEVAA